MDRKRSPQRSRQSVTTASSSQPARPASRGGQGVGDPHHHHHHHHVLSLVDGHGWVVGGSQDHRQRHSTVAGQLSAVVRQAHCCVRQNAAPSLGGDSECVQFGAGERRSKTTPRERRSGTAGRRSAVATVVWIVLSQLIHVGSVAASQALDADPGNSNASNAGNVYGNRFGRLLLNGTRSVGGAGPSLLGASTTVLTTEPAPFDGGVAFAAAAAADGTASAGFNDSSEMPQIPEYIRATSMVFCIIIMCLGVIGNVMVPIVILKTKDMRNSTNIFLTNLSIADLLVLLVCTPTVLVEVNSPPEVWVLGEEMCNRAVPFVELTVAHASVLTILAISFERYYAICEPLKAGYVCTKTRALLICLAAWTVAAILTSRAAMCLTKASNGWTFTFFLMTISLFFVLPLAILVVLYAIIARNLIASDRSRLKIRLSKPELSHKARKQVVLMLGAVVLAFFTCLLPFRVLTLWIILVPEETFQQLAPERYYNLLYFSRIMLYLNSAVNPILYNLMSSKFRKGFLRLCSCSQWAGGAHGRRKGRNRSATFTTTTTTNTTSSSTYGGTGPSLALGSCRYDRSSNSAEDGPIGRNNGTQKLTLSLDDLRLQLPADGDCSTPPSLPAPSSFYRLNLVRQYSSPLLLFSSSPAPTIHRSTGASCHRGGAFKRQFNVTFDEPTGDGGGSLLASAEAEQLLLRIDQQQQQPEPRTQPLRNALRIKFPRFHGAAARTRSAAGGKRRSDSNGRTAATVKQLSLDETLLTAAMAGRKV
uniref:G_PROTEIN_RECEP_F1_2 domain-containing protein n=1 Tax=Anopheles coluzzii TaxID=1518534 RepID=A0A6E8VBM8_ANOCL